jgi:DNA polymerase-3 subunit alpha
MVKIVSRQSLGKQPVYDLGVERDHNFLLGNGLIASNCFNKSHSTAYAYVTYQTAYLKANYPVEYMTALLTASSDNQDKVEKYRENCQKMGINVEPPDINRSDRNFKPIDKKILFGFSAVKNLGENAIETIINSRQQTEAGFESLADFCSRIDLRVVNKRALETLILSGAFDKLNPNRNQLMHDMELTIAWAQKRAKEKESGQMNLFDMVGEGSDSEDTFEQAPSASPVPDFSLQEKLRLEKEHLGFYVSEHPMKTLQKAAQILSPINLTDLESQKGRTRVSVVVMVNALKKITTKQGKPMAFLTLEDASGQSEAVVFNESYEKIQDILVEDAHLIIWGKIDKRDDKVQLIVEEAEEIEKVKMIKIELSLDQANDNVFQSNLKGILQENSGDRNKAKIPIIAIIGQGRERQCVRLGQNYWVQDEGAAVQSLKNAGFRASDEPLVTGA